MHVIGMLRGTNCPWWIYSLAVFLRISDENILADKCLFLRRQIVKLVYNANSGHIGGSLSATEIAAALYYSAIAHDPANPKWGGRDYVVWSKGHATPLAYSILADCGYFPSQELSTFRKEGSRLQGHVDRLKVPGIEASSGPLGQGMSMALGMALALRLDGKPNRVWAILSDGEHEEGATWEAIMAAGHYKADNLTAILDYNNVQLTGPVPKIMDIAPIAEKYRAFNWNVLEADGHNISALLESYKKAVEFQGKPTVVIARTVKGKGVSIFEKEATGFHGTPPKKGEYEAAMAELGPAKWPDYVHSEHGK